MTHVFSDYDLWKLASPEGPTEEQERDMERNDAIDALQQAGMEPMSTAPRNKEIVVVLDDAKLTRERVFWQDTLWPVDDRTGSWWAANGDGAPDSPPWPHWDDDELLGWLPDKAEDDGQPDEAKEWSDFDKGC